MKTATNSVQYQHLKTFEWSEKMKTATNSVQYQHLKTFELSEK